MRDRKRGELAGLTQGAVRPLLADVHDGIAQLREEITQVGKQVAAVQPASVELDQELADRIVKKLHGPLTIPQQFSDWIRTQASHNEILMIHPLGYGPDPGTMQYVLRSNGTLHLIFKDSYGAYIWQGTFVPPDFAEDH